MKKIKPILLIITLTLIISGCLEYEETIILNKDGSGKMEVHYFSPRDSQMNLGDVKFPKEKADIRDEVEKKYTSDKVKLTHFEVKDKGEDRHVYFTVTFRDVLDLNDLEQFTDNYLTFNRSNHKLRFQRVLEIEHDEEKEEEEDSFLGKLILSVLDESVFKKVKFRFEIAFPQKIDRTKSNADWIRGEDRAVWRYDLSDFIKQRQVKMIVEGK